MRLFLTILWLSVAGNIKAFPFPDSITVPASTKYAHPGIMQQLFIGSNYREVWTLPVKMPVFNIRKVKGGFTIYELGGGHQTKSLELRDKNKVRWVLRTVDKDIEKALPPGLQNTFVEWIVQDMVSAAHPYAPLIVGNLARKLDLQAPEPQLYYIPDDTAFGQYRKVFANTVCMLERKDPTPDNSLTVTTSVLLEKLKTGGHVDDISLLKMRLLDMLLADWDRHEDQIRWGVRLRNNNTVYYPIARDRDQALFYSDGLLLKAIQLFAMKHLTGFTKETVKLIQLNMKSWANDKILLKGLVESEWITVINNFGHTLNDDVLISAVKKLPSEVYRKEGNKILEILKARRNGLLKNGISYYHFLF